MRGPDQLAIGKQERQVFNCETVIASVCAIQYNIIKGGYWRLLNKLNKKIPYDTVIPLLEIQAKELKTGI